MNLTVIQSIEKLSVKQRILYQNFVSICGIILVVIMLLRHFKIVRGPNPDSGWFKDVVKVPVIRSILRLVY